MREMLDLICILLQKTENVKFLSKIKFKLQIFARVGSGALPPTPAPFFVILIQKEQWQTTEFHL